MSESVERSPATGRFMPRNQAAVRHGGHSWLASRKIPYSIRGARALRRELTKIRSELESMTPDLNVKKQLLIDQVISTAGFMRLFEAYVRRAGIAREDALKRRLVDFQPGFSFYLQMMNRQASAIQLLGLERERAERILAPYEMTVSAEKPEAKD